MKKNKFANTLSTIIMVVILICAIGLVVYLTTDVQSVVDTVSPMYLVIDDVEVREHSSGYMLDADKPLTVDVKYDIDLGLSSADYTVKVIPNVIPEKNFEVSANGEAFPYQQMGDLTAGFDIAKTATSFTVVPKGGINTILSYVYPNTSIGDCSEMSYKDMYTLVVTSSSGTNISIDFSVVEHYNAINLDMSNIIF